MFGGLRIGNGQGNGRTADSPGIHETADRANGHTAANGHAVHDRPGEARSGETDHTETLQTLAEHAGELGIEVEINPQQWARITDRATSAESTPHMAKIFHTAKMPSPDTFTYQMYHPSAFGSYISQSWYTTDELTSVLEDARGATDLETRLGLYQDAQELIVDGMPSVFIANPPYRIGINENVGGWAYGGVMSFDWDVHSMYRDGDGRRRTNDRNDDA